MECWRKKIGTLTAFDLIEHNAVVVAIFQKFHPKPLIYLLLEGPSASLPMKKAFFLPFFPKVKIKYLQKILE